MNFQAFVADSIATRAPIRREFEFGGATIVGYFLDLPALVVRDLLRSESADRDAAFLQAVVCDENGTCILTLDQARSLRVQHMNALMAEALGALGLSTDGRAAAKKP